MEEKRLEGKDFVLIYETKPRSAVLVRAEGRAGRIEVPEQLEGLPVKEISKKAFFNCRHLRFVILPDTVEEIGSWAFAHCRRLTWVELPRRRISFGKDVFLGCARFKKIALRGGEPWEGACSREDAAALLGAAATAMGDDHLCAADEAGAEDWLRRWDARMLAILRGDDDDGFEGHIPSGEEDGGGTDQDAFHNTKRRSKVRLAFLRLSHDGGLSEAAKKELEAYLSGHTKGCASEETWEVLLEELSEERRAYELFVELGCVTRENFDGLLQDMGEGHAEMKAYLMRYQQEHLGSGGFFDGLALDDL